MNKYFVAFNMYGEFLYCDSYETLHRHYIGMTAIIVEAETEKQAIEKARKILEERRNG